MKYSKQINDIFKRRADRWKYYSPSVRPSQNEIEQYRQMIEVDRKVEPRCLVLGSTPELRDLLHAINCSVTLIDMNEYMVECMSKLTKIRSRKEEIIIGSWLTHEFGVKKYDYVIGDHVINMIATSKYDELLVKVRNLLADGGSFISRVITIPEKEIMTNENALKSFSDGKIKYNDLIWIVCLNSAYDPSKKRISYAALVSKGRDLHDEKQIAEDVLEQFKCYDDGMFLSVLSEIDYDRLFLKHFKLEEKQYGSDFMFCRTMMSYPLALAASM